MTTRLTAGNVPEGGELTVELAVSGGITAQTGSGREIRVGYATAAEGEDYPSQSVTHTPLPPLAKITTMMCRPAKNTAEVGGVK